MKYIVVFDEPSGKTLAPLWVVVFLTVFLTLSFCAVIAIAYFKNDANVIRAIFCPFMVAAVPTLILQASVMKGFWPCERIPSMQKTPS